MKNLRAIGFATVSLLAVLTWSSKALAQNTCNSPAECYTWENLDSSGGVAIEGSSNGSGIGIEGNGGAFGVSGASTSTSGIGVIGGNTTGTSGVGVEGLSTYGPGVKGNSTSGYGVSGTSSSNIAVYGVSSTGNGIVGQNSDTTGSAAAVSAIAGSSSGLAYWGTGGIVVTGGAQKPGGGSWTASSDERIKKDIQTFRGGLTELLRVRPVTFKYNGLGGTEDDGKQYVGVVAQELEKVLPAMVTSRRGKLRKVDTAETDIKQVDPSNFTYLLINAIQQQQNVIEQQEARIQALEHRVNPLASSLKSLGGAGAVSLMFGLLPVGLIAAGRKRRKAPGARQVEM